eukprot:GEMP01064072.1.p2 GENE.GEMP01064072.1~~GEMP01064072.1.p2  ORF type:complete len:125 (+),score=11.77 GEMP01064072.1:458-832(+)
MLGYLDLCLDCNIPVHKRDVEARIDGLAWRRSVIFRADPRRGAHLGVREREQEYDRKPCCAAERLIKTKRIFFSLNIFLGGGIIYSLKNKKSVPKKKKADYSYLSSMGGRQFDQECQQKREVNN